MDPGGGLLSPPTQVERPKASESDPWGMSPRRFRQDTQPFLHTRASADRLKARGSIPSMIITDVNARSRGSRVSMRLSLICESSPVASLTTTVSNGQSNPTFGYPVRSKVARYRYSDNNATGHGVGWCAKVPIIRYENAGWEGDS